MKISITLKISFNQTSILFPKNCNFHIDQIKERIVKRQLKIIFMVQKKNTSNHQLGLDPKCYSHRSGRITSVLYIIV